MRRTYTIQITLDDTAPSLLRKFFGKRITTKPEKLVNMAVARVVSEAARTMINEDGYAKIDNAN